jgi:LCP family protein required for cell wall assembly
MIWVKRFLYLVYLALFLLIGVASNVVYRFANSFTDSKTSVRDVLQSVIDPKSQFPNQSHFTVLLIGQDLNHDKKSNAYTKGSRSDTIMMLAVDLDKKSLRACSVPRDSFVTAPDGKSGKINGTFARGGVDLLEGTLQRLFDVTLDYYVIVQPKAVREIVNAVGGVEVETIDEMVYNDNWGGLHVNLPKGRIFINGEQAEGYIRFREVNRYRAGSHGQMIPIHGVKGSKEEGDLRRTARQQELIHALVTSAKSGRNLMRLDKIIDTGFAQIKTNLSRTQLLALGQLFAKSENRQMVSGTVPGKDDTSKGAYYYVLEPQESQAMVDWLIKGDDDAMRRVIKISVSNGTAQKGLARTLSEQLVGQGFNCSSGGNAKPTKSTRIIYYRSTYLEVAKQVQQAVGFGLLVKGTRAYVDIGPDVRIEVGDDMVKKSTPTSSSGKHTPSTH